MFPELPQHAFRVRFRPTGPWRFGPDSGARDRVEMIYHSDAVYSAVTSAMDRLGWREEWLSATAAAANTPAVKFTSFFPFQNDTYYVVPPRDIWPPAESAKVRYKGARFVPMSVTQSLLEGRELDDSKWAVDGESQCLVPDRNPPAGPFRTMLRQNAAVDRLEPGKVAVHRTACLEFARGAGLWMIIVFADEQAVATWRGRVRSALQYLADSGFGGERSRGWGRAEKPQWEALDRREELSEAPASVEPPEPQPAVAPETEAAPEPVATAEPSDTGSAAPEVQTVVADAAPGTSPETAAVHAYWLLSLYTPGETDRVDWKRGDYAIIRRQGRIESAAAWGVMKPETQMIAEGSVLVCESEPSGKATDTAPAGFAHPVYRAGFAVAVPIRQVPA